MALLVAATAAHAAPERSVYAVIVANNRSLDPGRGDLRFADDDGARYFELLAPQATEAVLLTVLDAETHARHPGLASRAKAPTREALMASLASVFSRMKADRDAGRETELFFVYTGHGKRGPDGEGTITLWDQLFTRRDLYDQVLSRAPASVLHLVVDACDSYFFVNSRGGLPVAPSKAESVKGYLEARSLERYPHVGALLSTTSEQESHEWSAISAGVFSHQVRSALAGAADVNADGRVEYSEVAAFVAAANHGVEDVRGRVNLWVTAPQVNRNAPLIDLRRRSSLAYLLLPEPLEGRMWVEDARGIRRVELNKQSGRPALLALPASGEYWLRTATREAKFAVSRAGAIADGGSLQWASWQFAFRGAVQDTYDRKMFSTAYGKTFYSGFVASHGVAPVAFEDAELAP